MRAWWSRSRTFHNTWALAIVSILLGSVLLVFIAWAIGQACWKRRAAVLRAGHREPFRPNDGAFSVLRFAPRTTLHVYVSACEALPPTALHPLRRLLPVGVRIHQDARVPAAPASETLYFTDSFRMHRRVAAPPHRADAVVTSLPPDANKRVCVFGNAASATMMSSQTTGAVPGQRVSYPLRDLALGVAERAANKKAGHEDEEANDGGIRVLCQDEDDIAALDAVIFALGSDVARAIESAGATHSISELTAVVSGIQRGQPAPARDGCDADAFASAVREAFSDSRAKPALVAATLTSAHPVWAAVNATGADVVWYAYDERDMHRLRHASPLAVAETVDVPEFLLENVLGERRAYSVISYHALCITRGPRSERSLLPAATQMMLFAAGDDAPDRGRATQTLDVTAVNNFLSMHLPFHPVALASMRPVDENVFRKRFANPDGTRHPTAVGRPRYGILEQFADTGDAGAGASPGVDEKEEDDAGQGTQGTAENANVRIPMDATNVHGFLRTVPAMNGHVRWLDVVATGVNASDDAKRTADALRYDGTVFYLRGVPLRRWDKITLSAQRRGDAENGTYFVAQLREEDGPGVTLVDHVPLRFDPDTDAIRTDIVEDVVGPAPAPRVVIYASRFRHPRLRAASAGDRVFFRGSRATGVIIAETDEDSRTHVLLDTQPDPLRDGRSHPLYYCVTEPSIQVPEQCRETGNWWDRPCVTNEDCPYFQANRTYRNYRGGCVAGYCEMPLGVERRGFRDASPQSAPVCHGCPLYASGCCADGGRSAVSDYAFALDAFDRRQQHRAHPSFLTP